MYFVFPYPTYPRKRIEQVMGMLYCLGTTIFVVSYVVLITETHTRLQASVPGTFTSPDPNLSDSLETVMEGCEYEGYMTVNGIDVKVGVDSKSLPFAIISMLQHTHAVLVVQLLAAINSAAGWHCYLSNIRHMCVAGMRIPVHFILSVLAYLYCIALISLVVLSTPVRTYYSDTLQYCAERLGKLDEDKLLDSGFDGFHLFGTRLEWAMGAAIANLIIYTIGLGVRAFKSRSRAIRLFSMSDGPWEKSGVKPSVDEAVLKIHTAAREKIIAEARDAISKGESVRIVRSYALMTEEDYKEQVEEMRRQFVTCVKEENFRNMQLMLEDEPDMGGSAFHWGDCSTLQNAEPLGAAGGPVVKRVGEPMPPFGSGMMGRRSGAFSDAFNADDLSDLSLNRADAFAGVAEGFGAPANGNRFLTQQQWHTSDSLGPSVRNGFGVYDGSDASGGNDEVFAPDALHGAEGHSAAFTNMSGATVHDSRHHNRYGGVGAPGVNGTHGHHNFSGDELWDVGTFGDNNASRLSGERADRL